MLTHWPARGLLLAGAALTLTAAAPPTPSAPPPSSAASATADPEAVVAEEFVVHGHLPGPAWWKVSRGESKVFVLGIPGALPKGLAWDQSVLARRLQGANELIGRPQVTAGLGDLFGLGRLRTSTPMENDLSPALRERLAATEVRLGRDPGHYRHWSAAIAGLILVGDFRKGENLQASEPGATIEQLARRQGVHVVPAGSYKAGVLLKAIAPNLHAIGETCVTDALDEIDAGAEGVRAAAAGWAAGDPRAALTGGRGYEKCVNALPEGADLARQAMGDTAAAIERALAKPGHSIALVNLRTLLASDGVLQQLRAHGYTVTTPESD